jgi:iron complex transport system substrate-binding protein
MKFRKFSALLLSFLLLLAAAGCSNGAGETETPAPQSSDAAPAAPSPSDTSITVTDMTGKTVTLPEPPERVVALTASDCEILYAIGAGNTLVGRGEYCDYPEEVKDVPAVQSGSETNIEQIIALEPQIVILSTMAQTKEQIASLEAAGIRVFAIDADEIADVYTSIRLIGALMDRSEEAENVVKGMENTFAELQSKAKGGSGKTVYFEVSPLEYGLWTAGKGTFMDEIAAMLGLNNIFSDVEDWAEVSEEQVLERNPDYIVTLAMYFGEGQRPEEEIAGRQGWQEVKAVKSGGILSEATNAFVRPGPRLADGARILYDFVYGT